MRWGHHWGLNPAQHNLGDKGWDLDLALKKGHVPFRLSVPGSGGIPHCPTNYNSSFVGQIVWVLEDFLVFTLISRSPWIFLTCKARSIFVLRDLLISSYLLILLKTVPRLSLKCLIMVKCKTFQCFLSDVVVPVFVCSPWELICLASMTFLQVSSEADGAALTDYAPITLNIEGINRLWKD